ncbi:MAG: DUF58 domain-containing protein [SAR202 cluster bacterium]|nr:DUF58 domain-containing protein [SAR202 cluster bacterium]
MITTKGAALLVIAVLVFLLGRLTQVGWLYLVDAVLWGMLLFSAVLPWLSVAFLKAERKVELPGAAQGRVWPSEGDTVHIGLTLRNDAFWPRFFLNLSYFCPLAGPAQRVRRFFLSRLPGAGSFQLPTTLSAYQRGMHQLGPVVAESRAPFGLFRRWVQLSQPQPVLVYPQIHPLRRLELVDELSQTAAHSRPSRIGLDTAGSRPYVPGDPRRHIHWRNTARAGRPMVREMEDPSDRSLHLLFDATQVWGEDRETTLEYAIKIIVSVADYARRRGVPVQVWGGGLGDASTGNPASEMLWQQLLHRLALAAPEDGPSLAYSVGKLPPGSHALAVVSAGDQQGIKALRLAAPTLERLTVVALKDFGELAPPEDNLAALRQARAVVLRCGPGQLQDAWHNLEDSGGGSAASAPLSRQGGWQP